MPNCVKQILCMLLKIFGILPYGVRHSARSAFWPPPLAPSLLRVSEIREALSLPSQRLRPATEQRVTWTNTLSSKFKKIRNS